MCFDKNFRMIVKCLVGGQVRIEGLSFLNSKRQLKHKLVLNSLWRQSESSFSNAICDCDFAFLTSAVWDYSI